LAVAAVALRAWVWTRTPAIHNDGPIFIGLAQLMGEGEWRAALAHAFHPLYPACLLAVHTALASLGAVSGASGWETAGAAVSALSGGAAVLATYAWTRSLLGNRAALGAAAVLAVHPYAVRYSADVQSDGLYLALFLASVGSGWRALRDRDGRAAAFAGAASGLAYLTRPEGLGVLGVLAAMFGARALRGGERRHHAVALALLAAAGLLVVAPYLFHLRESSGQWALTRKKTVLELSGAVPERALAPVEAPASLLERSPFLETVVRGPRRAELPSAETATAETPASRLLAALAAVALDFTSVLRPEFELLALVGLWSRGRRAPELGYLGALGAVYGLACYGMAYGAGYLNRRHVLAPALLLLPAIGAALPVVGARVIRLLSRRAGAELRSGRAVAAAAVLLALVAAPKLVDSRSDAVLAERRAAEWLANRGTPDFGPIAAAKQRVAYYARAPFVPLPVPKGRAGSEPARSAVAYLQAAGARFVVVGDHWWRGIGGQADPEGFGLRRLHRSRVGAADASVFEVELEPGS
jgi:hypothetical protein